MNQIKNIKAIKNINEKPTTGDNIEELRKELHIGLKAIKKAKNIMFDIDNYKMVNFNELMKVKHLLLNLEYAAINLDINTISDHCIQLNQKFLLGNGEE